jgi:hypothetical protein
MVGMWEKFLAPSGCGKKRLTGRRALLDAYLALPERAK